jgi:hypothetical protein
VTLYTKTDVDIYAEEVRALNGDKNNKCFVRIQGGPSTIYLGFMKDQDYMWACLDADQAYEIADELIKTANGDYIKEHGT